MERIAVRIIGRAGCHLCDEAEVVVNSVAAEYVNVVIQHANLDDNPEWAIVYSDKIPVIHIDGDEVAHWRISKMTLAAELNSRGAIPVAENSE